MTHTKNKTELARLCGVTRYNLDTLIKTAGWPSRERKGWPVDKCVKFVATANTAPTDATATLTRESIEETIKMRRAEREMKEHRLAALRRDVIPVDEVKRTYTRSVIAAKSKLVASQARIGMKAKMRLGLGDESINTLVEILSEEYLEIQKEMSKGEWMLEACPHCKKTI